MANFEIESNNTGATATKSVIGVTTGGQLKSSGDIDFFKYTVSSLSLLNLKFSSPGGKFTISLYDSVSAVTPIKVITNTAETYEWAVTPGTYYIRVAAGDEYNSGQYTIDLDSVPFIIISGEGEENDSELLASPFVAEVGVKAALQTETDVDYLSFTLAQKGLYTVNFDFRDTAEIVEEQFFFKVSVIDTNGETQSAVLLNGDDTFDFYASAEGPYFIKVENGGAHTDGFYFITVEPSVESANVIDGGDFVDYLLGTATNDSMTAGLANDVLLSEDGNDTLDGGAGNDTLKGGFGDDVYVVDSLKDVVIENTNEGKDKLISSVNVTSLLKNIENLTLEGTAKTGVGNQNSNVIVGNEANNTLTGKEGNDTIDGGAGDDVLTGGADDDTYYVDSVKDKVVEVASGGRDYIYTSVDFFVIPANIEEIHLLEGVKYINGSTGANNIFGNDGYNFINGNAGNDTIDAKAGNDAIAGGVGNDSLTGGIGSDLFIFNSALSGTTNVDTVTDFEAEVDQIYLSSAIFKKLTVGDLSADNFYSVAGVAIAQDANDYILFNQNTGELFYDQDGTGAKAAVKFAVLTLVGDDALTNADFSVI